MKLYLTGLLALLMGMAVMTACSGDDDDDVSVTAKQLQGKWINVSNVWKDKSDPEANEKRTFTDNNRYILLNDDGTGVFNPYSIFEPDVRGTFEWKVSSGNKLVIDEQNGDHNVFVVTDYNGKELELTWYDDEDAGVSEINRFKKATD